MQTPQIMPRYEIEEVEGAKVMMRCFKYIKERDKDGNLIKDENGKVMQRREEEVVNIAEGHKVYNVYFPQGHHIQVVGEQALKDLNLDSEPKLIDMNSGEEVPDGYSSLKAMVTSRTKGKRRVVSA